ncbi:MAG: hypothetical protein J6C40_03670, partial [Lentisphaeria bacterium]|nr:hypothetical protein [Lentisphaeria bacterium]
YGGRTSASVVVGCRPNVGLGSGRLSPLRGSRASGALSERSIPKPLGALKKSVRSIFYRGVERTAYSEASAKISQRFVQSLSINVQHRVFLKSVQRRFRAFLCRFSRARTCARIILQKNHYFFRLRAFGGLLNAKGCDILPQLFFYKTAQNALKIEIQKN